MLYIAAYTVFEHENFICYSRAGVRFSERKTLIHVWDLVYFRHDSLLNQTSAYVILKYWPT